MRRLLACLLSKTVRERGRGSWSRLLLSRCLRVALRCVSLLPRVCVVQLCSCCMRNERVVGLRYCMILVYHAVYFEVVLQQLVVVLIVSIQQTCRSLMLHLESSFYLIAQSKTHDLG